MSAKSMAQEYYGLSELPENTVYAMAYVPFQQEKSSLYAPDRGFMAGTMYPDLNKPFCGAKCGDPDD